MRDLGTNRIYLHRPSATGFMMYRFGDGLDLALLKEAIRKAMGRHEQFCSRIVQTPDGEAGYEAIAEPVCAISVDTFEPATSDDEESLMDIAVEWAEEQAKERFDLASGELMRHVLISDTEETIWAIAYHYLAGDAMSFQYLAEDVFSLMEDPDLELAFIPWMEQPLAMPDASALALPARQKLQNMNKRWAKKTRVFGQEDFERLHTNFHEAYPLHLLFDELDEDIVLGLQSASREHNVRFTAMLAAAVALASQEKDTISVIVNVRPTDYRGVGIYSGGLGLQAPKRFNPGFWDFAEEFSKKLDNELGNTAKMFHTELIAGHFDGTLLDAGYYSRYDAFSDKVAEEMAHVYGIVSAGSGTQMNNMRVLPLAEDYAFGRLENVYFFPAMTPSYARAVGIATIGGRMAVTWSYYHDEVYETDLLERTLAILREVAR